MLYHKSIWLHFMYHQTPTIILLGDKCPTPIPTFTGKMETNESNICFGHITFIRSPSTKNILAVNYVCLRKKSTYC